MSKILLIIICFLLTSIIELLTSICLKVKDNRVYLLSIFINLFTNVIVNILFTYFLKYTILNILFSELIIIIIEIMFYYLIIKKWGLSIKYSFFCNLSSFVIGSVIVALLINF